MVIEIQNKEIKAIKDKILIYETKQAIKEIKENKISDAFEFLNVLIKTKK